MSAIVQQQRLQNIQSTLVSALSHLGYEQCLPYRMKSLDPQTILEETIYSLLDVLPTYTVLEECTFTNVPKSEFINTGHEHKFLEILEYLKDITEQLSSMATLFYEEQYSADMQKNFRKLCENTKSVANIIYETEFYKHGIRKSKDNILREIMEKFRRICKSQGQYQYFNAIMQESCDMLSTAEDCLSDLPEFPELKCDKKMSKISNPEDMTFARDIAKELGEKILQLENQLQQNNEEYAFEIQRYNQTLFDMQDKLHRYQLEIATLEDDLARLQQEKHQDQSTIQRLTSRVKMLEKQSERARKASFLANSRNLFDLERFQTNQGKFSQQMGTTDTNISRNKTNSGLKTPVFIAVKKVRSQLKF